MSIDRATSLLLNYLFRDFVFFVFLYCHYTFTGLSSHPKITNLTEQKDMSCSNEEIVEANRYIEVFSKSRNTQECTEKIGILAKAAASGA